MSHCYSQIRLFQMSSNVHIHCQRSRVLPGAVAPSWDRARVKRVDGSLHRCGVRTIRTPFISEGRGGLLLHVLWWWQARDYATIYGCPDARGLHVPAGHQCKGAACMLWGTLSLNLFPRSLRVEAREQNTRRLSGSSQARGDLR
jgi:hypothetical protein